MNNKQKTKDQHVVPETYLRNFVKKDQLYVLDIFKVKSGLNEFPKRKSPGGICYLKDYYTIQDHYHDHYFNLKGRDSHFVEDDVLTILEKKYPALYHQIISANHLGFNEAVDLSDFITTLKLRNPYWFENVIKKNIRQWAEKILPELVAQKKKEDPRAARLPDWVFEWITNDLLQQQDNDPDYSKQFQLFSLIERYNGRNERLREKIIDCRWDLYIAPENGPYFITTDNPGAAVGIYDGKNHSIKLDGGFIFYFPLSYRYALIFTDMTKDMAFANKVTIKLINPVPIDGELVNRINDILIQVNNKLLIGATEDYLMLSPKKTSRKKIECTILLIWLLTRPYRRLICFLLLWYKLV